MNNALFNLTGQCAHDVYISKEMSDPKDKDFKPLTEIDIEEGGSIAILCFSLGAEKDFQGTDLLTWKRNGKPITNNLVKKLSNAVLWVTPSKPPFGKYISGYADYFQLHLKDLTSTDAGVYTCQRAFDGCAESQTRQTSVQLNYIRKLAMCKIL